MKSSDKNFNKSIGEGALGVCEGASMKDEHAMPIAIRQSDWRNRAFSASEFSPIEFLVFGMSTLGFSTQTIAAAFHNSAFSMAVRSDTGNLLAWINMVCLVTVVIHHILKKERSEEKKMNSLSLPPVPDSKESECEKLNRVRGRRDGS